MKEIRVEFVMRPPKLKTCLSRERPAEALAAAATSGGKGTQNTIFGYPGSAQKWVFKNPFFS